jgi:hypothetical protein
MALDLLAQLDGEAVAWLLFVFTCGMVAFCGLVLWWDGG